MVHILARMLQKRRSSSLMGILGALLGNPSCACMGGGGGGVHEENDKWEICPYISS